MNADIHLKESRVWDFTTMVRFDSNELKFEKENEYLVLQKKML